LALQFSNGGVKRQPAVAIYIRATLDWSDCLQEPNFKVL
jgi:hypothetical protein